MEMTVFFYDSYPIIEYINNINPRFFSYFQEHEGILTLLNLLEVYYIVLRDLGKPQADVAFNTLYPAVVEPSKETIKRAMEFRLAHKKLDLSYADCLGYQIALDRGIKFLTGDRAFKDM